MFRLQMSSIPDRSPELLLSSRSNSGESSDESVSDSFSADLFLDTTFVVTFFSSVCFLYSALVRIEPCILMR
ncbi:hypothetical protein Anas_14331, partial [Armadillidium nasatum]